MRKPFIPGSISKEVDGASDVIFPRELENKPMAHMTQSELFSFMNALLGLPAQISKELSELDKEFMEDACEAWGNNGEPLQPEDCDMDSVGDEIYE